MTAQNAPPNNAIRPDAMPDVQFHDRQIMLRAGGTPEGICSTLQRIGQPQPSRNAVQQWLSRGYVPDRWRAALIYALLAFNDITPGQLFRRGPARPSAALMPRRRVRGKRPQGAAPVPATPATSAPARAE